MCPWISESEFHHFGCLFSLSYFYFRSVSRVPFKRLAHNLLHANKKVMASDETLPAGTLPESSDLTRPSEDQSKTNNQDNLDKDDDVSCGGKPSNSTPSNQEDAVCDKYVQECKGPENLTKHQIKKLKRRQTWEKKKEHRLQLRREKRQERRRKKQVQGTQKAEGHPQRSEVIPKSRKLKKKMSDPDASDVRVVIDCGFDDLMQQADVTKLSKQIQRSYASNRTSDKPFQFYICNFGDKTKARFQSGLAEHTSWDVNFSEQGLNDLFGKDCIVYLTSESPKVLKELDPSKAYIIGGLVDHNHHKGVCYQRAVAEGWDHAQLPIKEYMSFSGRKVLTVNHVFEILVAYIETNDWKVAFDRVVPQRKFNTISRRERRRRAHRKEAERLDESEAGSEDETALDGQEVEGHVESRDEATPDKQKEEVDDDRCESNNQSETGQDDQVGNEAKTAQENNVAADELL